MTNIRSFQCSSVNYLHYFLHFIHKVENIIYHFDGSLACLNIEIHQLFVWINIKSFCSRITQNMSALDIKDKTVLNSNFINIRIINRVLRIISRHNSWHFHRFYYKFNNFRSIFYFVICPNEAKIKKNGGCLSDKKWRVMPADLE